MQHNSSVRPRSEQIGLWAAYAILALAYLHWKKAKEILREPDRPAKIIGIVLINLFLAGVATLGLMVPLVFLFNLPFWNDTDKKCALTLGFFYLPIGSLLLLATGRAEKRRSFF